MAVDLPPDERTLQAAIMAAALVADPATAANIAKLIEIEQLSAHSNLEIVPDDGSGTQSVPLPVEGNTTDPASTASTEATTANSGAGFELPHVAPDDAANNHSFTPVIQAESSNNQAIENPTAVAANEIASGGAVASGAGVMGPAVLADVAPVSASTATPSNNEPLTPDPSPFDDPIRLPSANDSHGSLIDVPNALLSGVADSLNLPLVDNVVNAANDLITGLIHDIAIGPAHLLNSTLDAVSDIGHSLQSAILLDNGSIEVPSLHGSILDSLSGLAAAADGAPLPHLISDVLTPEHGDHDAGVLPLITDHLLDNLSHHLHLL